MPLEVFGVLLKLNQHFSMRPNVLNVIVNNISADTLPLNITTLCTHVLIDGIDH